ncbi:DUF7322 domain-containing protein [Halolamina sediminis]|uniref:DUF7322 domain-containing protein n=1 Tax=Halolamina sediminis TaxID=1480675 RepID=UPI0006B667EA|nr:hypothetical protein [Halolamina sediminis]
MSDDDPVETFVEETFDGEDDGVSVPETRDMEDELHQRAGTNAGGEEDLTEVDSETATAFWGAVIYVNAGVLLIALGPTVYALRGYPLVSAGLVAGGMLALVRAYWVYRQFAADDGAESDEDGDAADHDEDGEVVDDGDT